MLQIPGVDDVVTKFLEPTFADSKFAHVEPSTGSAWLGLVIGAAIAVAGIAIAYRIWVVAPGTVDPGARARPGRLPLPVAQVVLR